MLISLAGTFAWFDKSWLLPSIEIASRMTDAPISRLTLVLGGARSGKSRHAEELIMRAAPPWTYLATAEARDDEMRERIAIIARAATQSGKRWTRRSISPGPSRG